MVDKQNTIITAIARGSLTQLRLLIETVDDRDTARVIHSEMADLVCRLAIKHGFARRKKVRKVLELRV